MRILKWCQVLALVLGLLWQVDAQQIQKEYVVLASKSVNNDANWKKVVDKLVEIHQAKVVEYDRLTSAALPRLKELFPRYVAVVEKPENIDRKFIIDLNRMSRRVDEDIYSDFLWGIITGYDADDALALVERAQTPKIVKSAWCLGIDDFNDGKYFEKLGTNFKTLEWREKNGQNDTVRILDFLKQPFELQRQALNWAENNNPDMVLFQMEEFQNQIRLVGDYNYAEGILTPKGGKLWSSGTELLLPDNSRVCMMPFRGRYVYGTKESIPLACLNTYRATGLIGLTDYSFHGRGEWGTLKFWMTDAGRFTLPEAHFLNQQDLLTKLNRWSPEWLQEEYAYTEDTTTHRVFLNLVHAYEGYWDKIEQLTGSKNELIDKFGYMYERDIVFYYGDPAWNARMEDLSKDQPYRISYQLKGKKCIVTIETTANFSWERVCGEMRSQYDGFTDVNCAVGKLPLCYFFPERLKNPRLAAKQKQTMDVVVNKDFMFIYDAYWQPNEKYQIVLEVDK